jgi:hypothetical protein
MVRPVRRRVPGGGRRAERAAVARYLVGADALYRAPFDHLMLLDGWR